MRAADKRERDLKRAKHGDELVRKAGEALGFSLSIEDFQVDRKLSREFEWTSDLRNIPGLVVAYTDQARAKDIALCCDRTLGPLPGLIGFADYGFLGTVHLATLSFERLLDLSEVLNDSVLFCPQDQNEIVLFDYYPYKTSTRDASYTLAVQGEKFEEALAPCFENVVQLRAKN